ncbi:hypothetical protein AVEN_241258-1 [Araneus ventricosus]|uniref:Uncharacterized protein n=1 Tax=Araneus ventricosus TaxID=182803 RepID=A0A4Y2TYH3_ARAVE|nr:hypothetical protein AVEN_241258-1 [Araneus ventricosus]
MASSMEYTVITDTVCNDKFKNFIGPCGIPICSMYFEPDYNDNRFLDSPVYRDNFTSLESWHKTIPIYFSFKRTSSTGSRMSDNMGIGGRGYWKPKPFVAGRSGGIFTNPTLIELRQEISQYHWLRGAVTSFSALARSVRQS